MTLTSLSPQQLSALMADGPWGVAYNSPAFAQLNAAKVERVHCLALTDDGADSRLRFAICIGQRADGTWAAPFSAPFAMLAERRPQHVALTHEAWQAVWQYAQSHGARRMMVTLPPAFYAPTSIAHQANALSLMGTADHVDLNFHLPLLPAEAYEATLERTARQKLKRSRREAFTFEPLVAPARAYAVIAANRAEHAYPLRMTLAQVEATARILPAHFYVVSLEGTDVAAAQLFDVAPGVAQVIYWGDLKAYSHLRTMNFLSASLVAWLHHHRPDLHTLDIGPSTDGGIPNAGLCDFKESIGCIATTKVTWRVGQ